MFYLKQRLPSSRNASGCPVLVIGWLMGGWWGERVHTLRSHKLQATEIEEKLRCSCGSYCMYSTVVKSSLVATLTLKITLLSALKLDYQLGSKGILGKTVVLGIPITML